MDVLDEELKEFQLRLEAILKEFWRRVGLIGVGFAEIPVVSRPSERKEFGF
jgi:hypothetical protein